MIRLRYRTNDGEKTEQIGFKEFSGFSFQNGAAATPERLKFHAQHCSGVVELTNAEFDLCNRKMFEGLIPVKEVKC